MLNLTISSESQWKDVSDILSVRKYCQLFTHESNKFVTNNAIETNGGKTPQNLLKPPFNLQHVDSHLIHQCLVRPHPLSQMKAQSVHALQHNYATKSLLATMGRPTFTPKTAPSLRRSPPKSNTPIFRLTPLTTPNGTPMQSAVSPQYTFADRQMGQANVP